MTNWKYILIVVILSAIVGIGVLYQWQALKEEAKILESEAPEKITEVPEEEQEELSVVSEEEKEESSVSTEQQEILFSLPFHNSTKLLQVFLRGGDPITGLLLFVYDTKDKSSVFLGSIRNVSYTGNSGGLFVPIAITKDNNNIILDAEMGSPGAGGGSVDYGYAMIPITPAPEINWVIKDFWFIATHSAHFYDSFSKVVYVDEGEKIPHYSVPGPSNDGAIVFRNLEMESNKDFYSTAFTGYKRPGFKTPNDVMAGGAGKILEEENTSYEIIGLDENNGILSFKATVYIFSDDCSDQYCAEKSTIERSIPLP
jgi:hypothetical protein